MVTLKLGDCLEHMKNIPDKSIDMILCDLPYGTTHNEWDSIIGIKELWEGYNRIIKDNGAIILFSQQPFTSTLVKSNEEMFRYEWIWEKEKGTGFLNVNRMPLKIHENILVFYKELPTYNPQMIEGQKCLSKYVCKGTPVNKNYGKYEAKGVQGGKTTRYPTDIIKFKRDIQKSALHPTQKPVALCEYLIKTYTNEGDLVLDNCMGSGTTGVACVNTNRNFIGIELTQEYFDIARDRILEAEKSLLEVDLRNKKVDKNKTIEKGVFSFGSGD